MAGDERLAGRHLVLTACHSIEVGRTRCSSIDPEDLVWAVPAGRAKLNRERRTLFSDRVIDSLAKAQVLSSETGFVIPSSIGRRLSDSTISKPVPENGIKAVALRFCNSFRDRCGNTGQPREVAEAALAHAIANNTDSAYARSDLCERRRTLMLERTDHVTRGPADASEMPIGRTRIL